MNYINILLQGPNSKNTTRTGSHYLSTILITNTLNVLAGGAFKKYIITAILGTNSRNITRTGSHYLSTIYIKCPGRGCVLEIHYYKYK